MDWLGHIWTSKNSYYLFTPLALYKTFSNDSSTPICPMGRFAALALYKSHSFFQKKMEAACLKIKIIMEEQDSTHSRCQQNIQMFGDFIR